MLPRDELRIITQILCPNETYYKKIQEELEKKDKVKRYKKVEDNNESFKDLLEDKILGILGG